MQHITVPSATALVTVNTAILLTQALPGLIFITNTSETIAQIECSQLGFKRKFHWANLDINIIPSDTMKQKTNHQYNNVIASVSPACNRRWVWWPTASGVSSSTSQFMEQTLKIEWKRRRLTIWKHATTIASYEIIAVIWIARCTRWHQCQGHLQRSFHRHHLLSQSWWQ